MDGSSSITELIQKILDLIRQILSLLLPFERVFTFIQGLLQLPLDLTEMVAPVFHGLDVFLRFLTTLTTCFLLLLQFADQLLLMSDLFTESVNLIVLGTLVFLTFHTSALQGLDLVSETVSICCNLSSRLVNAVNELLLSFDSLHSVLNLLIKILLGSF